MIALTFGQWLSLISAVTAVLAVFVGPVASYLLTASRIEATVSTAEQRIEATRENAERDIHARVVSSSRQEWLNDLRTTVSEAQGIAASIVLFRNRSDDKPGSFTERVERLLTLQAKVVLMLNPEEEKHEQMIEAFRVLSKSITSQDMSELGEKSRVLSNISRKVLKEEWEEIKRESGAEKPMP